MFGTESRPLSRERPSVVEEDALGELFNYDAGSNDPFSENYRSAISQEKSKNNLEAPVIGHGDLGIDEEVEVTKKIRAPRVKLDENLLLSPAGIPKLRSRVESFKFRGKGHEFSDIAKLLGVYQLWLDDIFPKAKFLDALAMVEKQGHKKRIQAMRMEWINKGKSNQYPSSDESDINTKSVQQTSQVPSKVSGNEVPDDELDALLAEDNELLQSVTIENTEKIQNISETEKNNFDDDEEAMAEMDMTW